MAYSSRSKYHRLYTIISSKEEYATLNDDELDTIIEKIILNCYPYRVGADGSNEILLPGDTDMLDEWTKANLSSKYIVFLDGGYFKLAQDAVLFKLTWG